MSFSLRGLLSGLAIQFFALCVAVPAAGQVIISDGFANGGVEQQIFADGQTGPNGWTFRTKTTNNGDARFGYDYSALLIPEAPRTPSGDTARRGVALRTNVAAGVVDQSGIVLTNPAIAGKYTVEVDMWLNWSLDVTEIGTTQHAGLFVGKDTAANPASADFPVSAGAGAIFSSDGDCSNCDHILLKNESELDTFSGQYSVRDFGFGNQPGYDNLDVNTDPMNGALVDLGVIFPAIPAIPLNPSFSQAAGLVGFRWVTLKAEVDPLGGTGPGPDKGTTKFTLTNPANGLSYVLGTVDNSISDDLDDDDDGDTCDGTPGSEDICTNEAPVDMEGQVTLTIIDFFTSVARDFNEATAVFDNLTVTLEPAVGLPGDANGDGKVDLLDLDILGANFGAMGATLSQGDFNSDTKVDLLDLDILGANFGAMAATATAVPEGATATLATLAMTVAGCGWARRRRG